MQSSAVHAGPVGSASPMPSVASAPATPASSPAPPPLAGLIASFAKAMVHFDALACELPSILAVSRNGALKALAEQIKLLSESLRLSILMERPTDQTAEAGAQLLVAMRQLQLLGSKSRLHPSHQMLLRMGLGQVELIVRQLRELSQAPSPSTLSGPTEQ